MKSGETPHLNEIVNKSLSEQVLDALRDAILDGDLKPGNTLVETDLAAQLGVSRAPLREALRILNAEGLVEAVPYHGTKIRALTRADIEEIYSLREALEQFAVQRLIRNGDPVAAAEQLRAFYDEMLVAAQAGDLKKVNEIDRNFHRTLITLSGHNLLLITWNGLYMRVRQVMALLNRTNQDLTQVAYNHLPTIEAIEAGDEARAMAAIVQHVRNTGKLVAENWQEPVKETDQ
jgi:DNA-binding GntR family transcriptional regulator